jgi:putative transposase
MYSYEERMRAVALYIKLGKRVRATLRILGYPTKNSLKGWFREFEAYQELKVTYVRDKPKYTEEQKRAAVDHYFDNGRCMSVTIRALGYPGRDSFHKWIDIFRPGERIRIVGQAQNTPHPEEFKHAAVVELCTRQGAVRIIAQALAVDRSTLYNWKNQLLGREAASSMKHKSTATRQPSPPPPADRAELEKTIETLKRNIHQLQLEHDLLKKATELLKKGLGVNLRLLSNRDKVVLVDALKQSYALSELLVRLDLPRSSYFYHRARLHVPDKYADVRRSMAELFARNYCCYGYRRLRSALSKAQLSLSEKVVRRLMKQEQLVAATSKRRRYGSYLGEISPAPENLIDRNFKAQTPNAKWLTDITEFQIPAGKVYLSPMIDCFDGLVVSWTIGTRPDAELVNTMLDAAVEKVNDVSTNCARPIVHSDRGAHYRWPGWLARIGEAKLVRSMSRKGCSPDNAACEGFFGRLKNELFHPGNWRDTSIEQFINALDKYIRWYNEKRIKISLGSLSPVEYRANLGLAT